VARIRFRSDNRYIAEQKALGRGFERVASWATRDLFDATPAAEPGDIWRVYWYSLEAPGHLGPPAGYDICCITCRRVHSWNTATNCASRKPIREEGTGKVIGYTCAHSGVSSCWQWTGSAEEGTLTASPSLYSREDLGGCGYHGFLRNGEIT
jgi:hypothetical protein